jgi:hypothetical protein
VRWLAVVVLVGVVSTSVHAEPDKPWAQGVSEQEQAAALAIYKAGNAEFEESRYAQALAKYREAIQHWDHPAVRFNMAVSLVNLDQPLEAYESLTAALRFGDAPLGAEAYAQALTYKKLLDGQLTHLRVTCDLDGATVTLDGQPLFAGKGEATKLLRPGSHQVVASKPGYLTETAPLVLVPGKEQIHAVKLQKIEVHTHLVRRWSARTPWLVVGAGAGALVLGGVLDLQARSDFQSFDDQVALQCPAGCSASMPPGMQQVAAATRSLQTKARVENIAGVSLLAVGGAAVVAGLVGVYLNLPRSVVEHAPLVVPTGNGAMASWTW